MSITDGASINIEFLSSNKYPIVHLSCSIVTCTPVFIWSTINCVDITLLHMNSKGTDQPAHPLVGGSDFRLYDGSDLKTYLLMRW